MDESIRRKLSPKPLNLNVKEGFTVVEVIVASSIMIVLCVGLLSVFSYVVKINRGENIRAQALSGLQQQVEYYRSLKFVPLGSDTQLNAGTFPNRATFTSPAPESRVFNISVKITNLPTGTADASCKFKEIEITAVPAVAESGWLSDLKTTVTIQRVRSN